jgi:hypothetical protein
MQKHTYLLIALLMAGCVENKSPKTPEEEQEIPAQTDSVTDKPSVEATPASKPAPLPEKVLGERTNGSVTLLDTVNGKEIAVVDDNTLLSVGVPANGWAAVMLETSLSDAQEKSQLLKAGQQLVIDGKTAGKLLKDVSIEDNFTAHDGRKVGVIYGYVPVSKIKQGSVIETALSSYLADRSERMLPDLKPFIKQFQLEPTHFNEPYQEYYTYESAVEDPSPGYRIVLVFYKNKLIGMVSSRGMQPKEAKHQALDRGYHGYFYPDTDPKIREAYIKMFNQFINAAD